MKAKKFRTGLLLLSSPLLAGSAWATTITVGPSGADYTTIQAAVAASNNGDDIQIAAGTYTLTGTLDISKSITLIGASETAVIIDASATGASWGIHAHADNITLSNFTVLPPISLPNNGGFAIHAAYEASGPGPYTPYSGLTLSNITIQNGHRTSFDIHGYDNVTLTDLTATGNIRGNGIQLSGCDGATFTGCTTSGNAWGGLAFYASKIANLNRPSTNIIFDFSQNSIGEFVYAETEQGLVNSVSITGSTYLIDNDYNSSIDSMHVFTDGDLAKATSLAQGLNSKYSNTATVLGEAGGNSLVVPGLSIQAAVDAASPGDTILLSGNITLTSSVTIPKQLIFDGVDKSTTKISGSNALASYFMLFSGASGGSTVQNISFEKTDKAGPQNLIGLQTPNITFQNCDFTGQYVLGDPDVSRAFEISAGASGFSILNCSVIGLRQPGYINTVSSGLIQNGYVAGTRGWVIDGGLVTFTGNAWGTGPGANAVDIALLASTPYSSLYDPLTTLSGNNNGATISNQRTNGQVINLTQNTGHPTIQSAIDSATAGDTIEAYPGIYKENVVVSKSVTIHGPNAGIPGNGIRGAEAIVQPATSAIDSGEIFHVTASDVTIDGFVIDGDNPTLISGFLGTNGADQDAAEGVTVYVDGVSNLNVSNNVIRNLSYFGVTLFGASYSSPASSGHVVANNLFEHLGTYDVGSGIAKWGGGVLLYNSQYARIEDNVMQDVRLGVQTGNFHNANPGAAASQEITGNSIEARRIGIFHNLHTSLASPITLSDNSITALGHPEETLVKGIVLASLSVPSISQDNIIDLSAATTPSIGYEVWNVKSTAPASISGGSVTAASQGVFINNYEGYNSNANDGAHASVDGLTISPTSSGTGIRVLDSLSSTTHAPVQLAIGSGVDITGGTNGLVIEGANASQSTIGDLALSGQSGNYIELIDNANNVDATSATFEGKLGSAMDLGELFAVEAKVVHQYDDPALGLVTWDAGFNPASIVISDTQIAGDLTIPAGTTVTVTPTGSLTADKLELEDGAELVVNEGDLAIGEDTVISGTFTIFNSFGSWNINGNTTFNIGQSLALISDVHVAANKTLTVNGGGELILDGCVIDSQTPGSPYTITTAADGVLTMARNVVSDAIIDINTLTGSVPTDVVSRVYDNSFATSAIEATADAKVYHNLFDSLAAVNTDVSTAFADVDGWGNITDANLLQNKLTLDFDAPVDPSRTLDAAGNLFVQSLDPVAMRIDVSVLGSNGITAAEALLGYNSNMLSPTGSPTVVDPEGIWQVIAETSSLTPPSSLGMVDSALGLQLTSGQPGSSADETIARVDFTAGNAGQTLGFFRVQNDRVFDGNGVLIKDTRLTKSVAGLPSYLAAFTANTGELVIDNEEPEILAAPITGTQVQPSQVAPVNVLNTANPVFRTSEPLVLTFSATDNGHGLSGIDTTDTANDLVLYDVNSSAVINPAGYTVSTTDVGGVVTYIVSLDVPAATPAGVYPVAATVQDRSGNVSTQTTLGSFIIANEAQVNVELQGFTGTTRDVTFVATGGVTTTWTKTITNFVSGSGFAILENVPAGTTSISAKTAWTLRSKVAASFTPAGVGTANLTGLDLLKAGDITGDNVVNTLDYSVLRYNWLTANSVSDISGDGGTNGTDYNLMRGNFYTAGSAQ